MALDEAIAKEIDKQYFDAHPTESSGDVLRQAVGGDTWWREEFEWKVLYKAAILEKHAGGSTSVNELKECTTGCRITKFSIKCNHFGNERSFFLTVDKGKLSPVLEVISGAPESEGETIQIVNVDREDTCPSHQNRYIALWTGNDIESFPTPNTPIDVSLGMPRLRKANGTLSSAIQQLVPTDDLLNLIDLVFQNPEYVEHKIFVNACCRSRHAVIRVYPDLQITFNASMTFKTSRERGRTAGSDLVIDLKAERALELSLTAKAKYGSAELSGEVQIEQKLAKASWFESLNRAASLLRDISDYSKKKSGTPISVELSSSCKFECTKKIQEDKGGAGVTVDNSASINADPLLQIGLKVDLIGFALYAGAAYLQAQGVVFSMRMLNLVSKLREKAKSGIAGVKAEISLNVGIAGKLALHAQCGSSDEKISGDTSIELSLDGGAELEIEWTVVSVKRKYNGSAKCEFGSGVGFISSKKSKSIGVSFWFTGCEFELKSEETASYKVGAGASMKGKVEHSYRITMASYGDKNTFHPLIQLS